MCHSILVRERALLLNRLHKKYSFIELPERYAWLCIDKGVPITEKVTEKVYPTQYEYKLRILLGRLAQQRVGSPVSACEEN
jgi:hypothetical protein